MQTFKQWIMKHYGPDELQNIVNHGVSGFFSSLIYDEKAIKLYQQYGDNIWEMLAEDADNHGMTIFEMINYFNGASQIVGRTQFENLLVRYAIEKIAYDIIELDDNDDETDDEEE